MEKILKQKSLFSLVLVVLVSVLSGVIAVSGFALGDLQAVIYSAIPEMCGLFLIAISVDHIQQEIDDLWDM